MLKTLLNLLTNRQGGGKYLDQEEIYYQLGGSMYFLYCNLLRKLTSTSFRLDWFRALTLSLFITLAPQLVWGGPPRYRLVDLTIGWDQGWSGAQAVNGLGQIVGFRPVNVSQRCFLWDNGNTIDLGTIANNVCAAVGVNDQSQVVGFSAASPFLWTETNGMQILPNTGRAGALSINNKGQIVGWVLGPIFAQAVIWENDQYRELEPLDNYGSYAYSINNQGWIAGRAWLQTFCGNERVVKSRGFLWIDDQPNNLGTPEGMDSVYINAINDLGQIVGTAENGCGTHHPGHAYLWSAGVWTLLHTLTSWPTSGAKAINNKGQVVGTLLRESGKWLESGGFLWQDGVMYDLEELTENPDPDLMINPTGISDSGIISATANLRNQRGIKAVALIPVN